MPRAAMTLSRAEGRRDYKAHDALGRGGVDRKGGRIVPVNRTGERDEAGECPGRGAMRAGRGLGLPPAAGGLPESPPGCAVSASPGVRGN